MKIEVNVINDAICKGCDFLGWRTESLYFDGIKTDFFSCENLEICRNAIERAKRSEEKTGTWLPVIRIDRDGHKFHDDDEWYGDLYQCNICGEHMIDNDSKFCPGCGAKMKKDIQGVDSDGLQKDR